MSGNARKIAEGAWVAAQKLGQQAKQLEKQTVDGFMKAAEAVGKDSGKANQAAHRMHESNVMRQNANNARMQADATFFEHLPEAVREQIAEAQHKPSGSNGGHSA